MAIVLKLRERMVGAVVDAVSDVLVLPGDAIKAAPEMASAVDARFITGIGSVGERMLILIDIEALLGSPSMGLVEATQ